MCSVCVVCRVCSESVEAIRTTQKKKKKKRANHSLIHHYNTPSGVVHMPVATLVSRLTMHPDLYEGVIDCARQTYQSEGISGFYHSIGPYLLANVSFF